MIKDLHTEIKVLRHLQDYPKDFPALKKNDFSSDTAKAFEKIRLFNDSIGNDDLAACCGNNLAQLIVATDDNNPDYWYSKLIKLSVMRKAEELGWDDWVREYIIEEDSPDGEKNIIFTSDFENSTIEEIKDAIIAYTDELVNSCRECYESAEEEDFMYADELPRANEEYEWLIEGLIKERTFNELVAPSKSGKSQLAYQLAYEVQNGMPFLDIFPVKKCDVLYVDCELDPAEIKEREANLIKFKNGKERFKISSWGKKKKDTDRILAKVKRAIRRNKNVGLVVFDNFYSFVDGEFDTNDVGQVSDLLDKLKFELTSMGVTVILVNHTTKSLGDDLSGLSDSKITDSFILNSPFGSLAHGAKVDTTILLQKEQEGKKLHITGRKISPIVRVSCKSDESTYWFFQHIGGIDAAEDALNKLTEKEIEQVEAYFDKKGKNDATLSTIVKNIIKNRELTAEMFRNSGYKVEIINKNTRISRKK